MIYANSSIQIVYILTRSRMYKYTYIICKSTHYILATKNYTVIVKDVIYP